MFTHQQEYEHYVLELIEDEEFDVDDRDEDAWVEEDVCPVCDGVGDIEETCSTCWNCYGSGYL